VLVIGVITSSAPRFKHNQTRAQRRWRALPPRFALLLANKVLLISGGFGYASSAIFLSSEIEGYADRETRQGKNIDASEKQIAAFSNPAVR
jgi:hypothetical protein